MRFTPQLPSSFTDKGNKNSAKAKFMQSHSKGSRNGGVDAANSYQDVLREKLDEARTEAMKGSTYTFNLPGTDAAPTRELSKHAQEVIQKVAEKKAKQAQKKAKKADIVTVQAKYFTGIHGGRIDKAGKIYDSAGQVVLEVDKTTGKIKNKFGNTVAKYDPNSPYSEHRICELIAKHSSTNKSSWFGGAGGHGVQQNTNGVWGRGGSIWGSSDSDNNSGWW